MNGNREKTMATSQRNSKLKELIESILTGNSQNKGRKKDNTPYFYREPEIHVADK